MNNKLIEIGKAAKLKYPEYEDTPDEVVGKWYYDTYLSKYDEGEEDGDLEAIQNYYQPKRGFWKALTSGWTESNSEERKNLAVTLGQEQEAVIQNKTQIQNFNYQTLQHKYEVERSKLTQQVFREQNKNTVLSIQLDRMIMKFNAAIQMVALQQGLRAEDFLDLNSEKGTTALRFGDFKNREELKATLGEREIKAKFEDHDKREKLDVEMNLQEAKNVLEALTFNRKLPRMNFREVLQEFESIVKEYQSISDADPMILGGAESKAKLLLAYGNAVEIYQEAFNEQKEKVRARFKGTIMEDVGEGELSGETISKLIGRDKRGDTGRE